MLGKRLGYYTSEPTQAQLIDEVVEFCEGLMPEFMRYINIAASDVPLTDDDCMTWFQTFWNPQTSTIDMHLQSHNKNFIAGTDRPTIADFKAFAFFLVGSESFNPGTTVPIAVSDKISIRVRSYPRYANWVRCM